MYNNLSVKVKIPIIMGIASFGVFTLICVMLLIPLRKNTLNDSAQAARFAAELAGEQLAVKINASATIMPARASVISSLISSDLIQPQIKRQTLMEDMKTLVENEATAVTNCWVMMEPNSVDGRDSLFINQPGCSAKGVLRARWNSTGRVSTIDYEVNDNLYRQVKQSRQSMMSQPYQGDLDGKIVWMITSIAPIMNNGLFYGVVATDFDLTGLCEMVNSLNSIGDGKLVTDKGYIVAHRDQARIGTLAEFGNRDILDRLQNGKEFEGFFSVNDVESFKVYVPIMLGNSARPWFYAVDVSKETIYKSVRKVETLLIVFFIIGVFLISITGFFMIRPMLNSVINVTEIIRQLSLGRINLNIDKDRSKDEIGTMKRELSRLVDGLKNTANFAQNIGEGDLNAEYSLLSDDDVLGSSLLEMRTSLKEAEKEQSIRSKEEEQRNWGTAGLAKFAEILRRDNDNLEALSYNVISNMVKYLGINQGGLFVLNEAEYESDRVLEMKACYAFDRKKFTDKQVRIGEGLVGTCYLEGEPIYMTDVPNEYITITSGLGDANPRAILICPLKVNDQIFGVIELASFLPFESYQLDFVKKVSESIAATISAVNVNIRTNRLLEQTKLQAEEMANQEEELRQNMEEMQATQEESRRREIELSETLAKMEETQVVSEEKGYQMQQWQEMVFNSFNMGEFSPEGMMTDINQNTLSFFEGLTKADFVGKYLVDFFGKEEEGKILSYSNKGDKYENIHEIPTGPNQTTVFHHKFIPICNKDGKLLRILMLAYLDETEKVKEKAHWFESLLDSITDSISVTDMDGKVIFLNQASLDMLGTTREKSIGIPCADVWKIENCNTNKCGNKLLKEDINKSDFRMGDQIFMSNVSYIKDLKGNNVGHIEIINNITEAANREFELKQLHDLIFDSLNVGEFSADGYVTNINQNLLDLWGIEKDYFVGKHYSYFVGDEAYNMVWADMVQGKHHKNVRPASTSKGTMVFRHNFMPICNKDGKLLRVVMLAFPENS